MGVIETIDVKPGQRKLILDLVRRFLPDTTVWVYGSRVRWTARPQSDLDMVAFASPAKKNQVSALKEAFEESDLPFRVDLFVWDEVPEQFRKSIEAERVVLVDPHNDKEIFPKAKLGPLCSKIGSGATPRGGGKVYLDHGKVVLIRSQNVRNDAFDKAGLVFIDDKSAKQLTNVTVEAGDVLLNITGDSVARCCQVSPSVLPARVNQHVAIIRPFPDKLDARFLRYYLVSPAMQNHMLGMAAGGATRNALTKAMIESFDILLPDIFEQRAIAHILGSLDDKIELNRKMNETLEAMAQALFRSWFIDFDPVIDNALAAGNPIPEAMQSRAARRESIGDARKPLPEDIRALFPDEFMHTDELGWIPKGWKVGSLSMLADLNPEIWKTGDAPKQLQYVDLANTKNGRINIVVPYEFDEAPSRARRVLRQDDTIIGTVRPGNRSYAYIHDDGLTGSTGFAVMRPKNECFRSFVYLCLTRDEVISHFAHLADGGAYPAIKPELVASIACAQSDVKLFIRFDEIVSPWIRGIGERNASAQALSILRDTLLPKLLSGEIRVAASSS